MQCWLKFPHQPYKTNLTSLQFLLHRHPHLQSVPYLHRIPSILSSALSVSSWPRSGLHQTGSAITCYEELAPAHHAPTQPCVPAWSEAAALGWCAEPMLRCATLTCDPWPPAQVSPARSVFILITRVMGLMD